MHRNKIKGQMRSTPLELGVIFKSPCSPNLLVLQENRQSLGGGLTSHVHMAVGARQGLTPWSLNSKSSALFGKGGRVWSHSMRSEGRRLASIWALISLLI